MELDQLFQALRAADARAQQGDTQAAQDARQIAQMIQRAQSAPAPQVDQPSVTEDVGRGFLGGALSGAGAILDLPSMIGRAPMQLSDRFFGTDMLANRAAPTPFIEAVGQVAPSVQAAAEFEPQTVAGGYAETAGEFLPGLVTPGGPLARIGYGVLAPAALSETAGLTAEALGAGETGEMLARLGGAVVGPVAAERTIRGLISPMAGAADETALRAAATLQREGVPVTAGQQMGSMRLMAAEDALTPSTEQLEAFSQSALRSIGSDATRASSDVLRAANQRIGGVFEDVTRNMNVDVQPFRISQAQRAIDEYVQTTTANPARVLVELPQRLANQQSRPNSRAMLDLRSTLSGLTKSADGPTRAAAIETLEAVDDIIADSLRAAGRDADISRLSTARQQWRDYLAIERAATGAAGRGTGGLLTPEALGGAIIQQSRRQYATGQRGDLGELSIAGDRLLRQAPPVLAGGRRTEAALPRLAGAGAGSMLGGPLGAAAGALAPEMLGGIVRAAPMQAYLRNQLVGPSVSRLTPAQRALIYGPSTGFPSVFNQGGMQ
jgi:hypothetical protein